jgi:hypothetical protein
MKVQKYLTCVIVLMCLTSSCPPAPARFRIDITNSHANASINSIFAYGPGGSTSNNLLNSDIAPGASRNFFVRMSDIGAGVALSIELSNDAGVSVNPPGGFAEGILLTIEVFGDDNNPTATLTVS